MQIDQLQIELRPRSHAQALDLGFALLRSHAAEAYKAFLALWLPLMAVCAVMTVLYPKLTTLWMCVAWWVRPLLERAPLYVLSRQVFGTSVTWQEALRAWPRQLGGGTFRLLVWGRIVFASGRGLMQPVWQLEGARGRVAAMRMRVMRANGTGWAAFFFGVVCTLLEGVLQVGLIFFLAMFAGDGDTMNPFKFVFGDRAEEVTNVFKQLLWLGCYATSIAIVAPIYTACCFTLYLNRRASLEAWDLELQLRQITRPQTAKARPLVAHSLSLSGAAILLVLSLGAVQEARASDAPATEAEEALKGIKCIGPILQQPPREAPVDARQAQVRKQLDKVYAHKDLRSFECVENWQRKNKDKAKKKDKKRDAVDMPFLNTVATIMKIVLIALAIGLVGFALYRFRDRFPTFGGRRPVMRATEVGGLDIRAESLPDDITGEVRALWLRGERRLALALLYRATLSRLVANDGLHLRQGDTEGDCLRAANSALQAGRLSQGRLDVTAAATTLWLNGAYGDRWPNDATLYARCDEWDRQFGAAEEKRA